MTFEDGSVYAGPFDKDRMVNRSLSGQVEISAPPPPPTQKKTVGKSSAKPKDLPKPKEVNPVITTQRAKKNVEVNPYKNLIDISDLTYLEEDPIKAEKEVQKILLQYNSYMKHWYEAYSVEIEAKEREESFTMCSQQLWRFLKDCKIISYKVSIANMNRLFLCGSKNIFKITGSNADGISTNEQSSLSRLSSVMAPVPNLDISNIPSNHQESISDDEGLPEISGEDVHNNNRPILFRQFTEAIVRAAYLKYSNGGRLFMENVELASGEEKYTVEKPKSQIGIALLRLLHERLVIYGGNRTCKTRDEEIELEEGMHSLDLPVVQKVFNQYSRKDRGQKNKSDLTISVQSVLQLLRDCLISPSLISLEKLIQIIEKYHDDETSYTSIARSKKSDKVKNRVLAKILGLELTEYEFYETLILVALEITPKENKSNETDFSTVRITVERFLNDKIVTGLIQHSNSGKYKEKTITVSKTRVFPKSAKQIIVDNRELAIAERVKNEANESLIMSLEDNNIES